MSPGFLKSELLSRSGFEHAFFTRQGGVSSGAYASLNFSFNVGDEPESVAQNLERAGQALGLPGERLFWLSQVHGTHAIELSGHEMSTALRAIEGDALLSHCTTLACGVQTADCIPLLLADTLSGAVAAVHCGWRGIAQGIVAAVVSRLVGEQASARLVAAVGPHISVDAFEVSPDVASRLAEAAGTSEIVVWQGTPKPYVNLRALVRRQLVACGLDHAVIDDVEGCTVGDAEHFFSYRRDGKRSGRHLSAIRPRAFDR